jgi:hypothetical protein
VSCVSGAGLRNDVVCSAPPRGQRGDTADVRGRLKFSAVACHLSACQQARRVLVCFVFGSWRQLVFYKRAHKLSPPRLQQYTNNGIHHHLEQWLTGAAAVAHEPCQPTWGRRHSSTKLLLARLLVS